jgi:hypothetical protein
MKALEFEKVSISDLRKELDRENKPVEASKCTFERTAQAGAVLTDEAARWIASLPVQVRPIVLAQKFPRIANSIADLWRRVARCEEYLDTLVVDLRGDRTGFPLDVAKELNALRSYYAQLHPQQNSAWDFEERG